MSPGKPQLIRDTAAERPEPVARELAQVLEQCGNAVIVKDLNAVVTYWNREATALYGFSAEEAVGNPLRKLHAAELSEADYERLLARVRSGRATASVSERSRKDGKPVRVSLKTTPLMDQDGQLIGEITIATDITAMHEKEQALQIAQQTIQARLKAIRDANRSLARQNTARRKAEAALRRNNQELKGTIRQLESFHRDGAMLSHMAELLQSCTKRNEAYEIVRETGSLLFSESPGSLFIFRESRDVLEHVASWGNGPAPEVTLAPDECWALRLGGPHFVPKTGAIRCGHAHAETKSYVCMPVHGQGQILGLIHITVDVNANTRRPARDTEQRLRALTDRVGPALANLNLRDSLRELALRDGLTGLYNRRYMEDALDREIHRAERSGKPVAVVMIDIDNFKRFNDKFGHDAGDFVLSALARAITKNIRPADMACRYGGEEFCIVLPEADLQSGHERAEQMRLAIRDTNLTHLGQTLPAPTASFGVAVYPGNGARPVDVLKAADEALYRAKHEGRDRVCDAPEAAPPVYHTEDDADQALAS
jgi:diguanylate cyclase (GGDEF)-like protein/PAS domain S-box-containing protein